MQDRTVCSWCGAPNFGDRCHACGQVPTQQRSTAAPLRTLCHRLADLGQRMRRGDPLGPADRELVLEGAAEVMRLRGVVRVNALRAGHTHADADAVIYPETQETENGNA